MTNKKIYKRAICATLHRKKGNSTIVLWRRHYSRVSTALKKAVEFTIMKGRPGDVIELTHSNFEFAIATTTLSVNAKDMCDFKIEFHVKEMELV